jgi:hypothetical protein
MALKRCLRARALSERSGSSEAAREAAREGRSAPASDPVARLPVRESKLTRLLAPFFLDVAASSAVVLATVSPGAAGLEHAIDTLQHCCLPHEDLEDAAQQRPKSTILIPDVAPGDGPARQLEKAESLAVSEAGSLRQLSPAAVCEWWTRAAEAAAAEVSCALAPEESAAASRASLDSGSTFDLRLSAQGHAKLRLTGTSRPPLPPASQAPMALRIADAFVCRITDEKPRSWCKRR